MKIPDNANMISVKCNGEKKGRPCRQFLGYYQINAEPHTAIYYCHTCGSLHAIIKDEFGVIHRERTYEPQRFHSYAASVMIVEA